MIKVIILNGCPNIGKDTLADLMVTRNQAKKLQFKDVLYVETAKYFDIPVDGLINLSTDRDYKERPSLALKGYTPREALIHVSEEVIKPKYGNDFFGLKMIDNIINSGYDFIVVPDGGFVAEFEVLAKYLTLDVHLVRLHREGYDFEKDSRNYVYSVDNITEHDVTLTHGQVEQGFKDLLKTIGE